MNAYRNFENDPDRFPYDVGVEFLSKLHENNQHYIPIIDAGIYVPIPGNQSDEYPPFERGLEQGAFIFNPDGSLYIGQVWPGYCGTYALSFFAMYNVLKNHSLGGLDRCIIRRRQG